MRLFAIGDTHLPSTRNKDMHRFGWTDHPLPLQRAWDEKVRRDVDVERAVLAVKQAATTISDRIARSRGDAVSEGA